jgi:tetratricopeptide (TPR) repeat protein
MLRAVLVALLCAPLAACGGKKAAPAVPPATPPAAAAAPDAGPPARPAPPTKEARRAYRKHLAAGRKHGVKSEWGEARVEFEAALAAIPHDGRALSELAWAAFNAGDHERARQAGREAVAAAGDPRLKAASLYNLGRVEEASARKDQAARLYRESLALRPSKTVEARLAGLGKEVEAEAAGTGLPCPEPRPDADDLCACLGSFAEAWNKDTPEDDRACNAEDAPGLAGWSIVHATLSQDTESIYLAARGPAGWSIVAELAEVYSPGAFGVSEEWKLISIRERTLGGRRVVEIVGQHDRTDSDAGIAEVESESATRLTVCVVGANGAPTTCPLEVPTKLSYEREKLEFEDEHGVPEEVDEETKKLQTPGLPISRQAELRVDLGEDGTATVQLVKGSADDAFRAALGPHRLW